MKLYELVDGFEQVAALLDQAEAEGAETPNLEPLKDTLDSLQLDIETKADNIAKFVRSLQAEADALKAEADRITERRKAKQNKAEYLKNYLESEMLRLDKKKVAGMLFSFTIQNNPPSVEVLDESRVPDRYKIPRVDIDKRALLADLKNGVEVAGAQLKQTKGLRIR